MRISTIIQSATLLAEFIFFLIYCVYLLEMTLRPFKSPSERKGLVKLRRATCSGATGSRVAMEYTLIRCLDSKKATSHSIVSQLQRLANAMANCCMYSGDQEEDKEVESHLKHLHGSVQCTISS